jgi:hypothetical protein
VQGNDKEAVVTIEELLGLLANTATNQEDMHGNEA